MRPGRDPGGVHGLADSTPSGHAREGPEGQVHCLLGAPGTLSQAMHKAEGIQMALWQGHAPVDILAALLERAKHNRLLIHQDMTRQNTERFGFPASGQCQGFTIGAVDRFQVFAGGQKRGAFVLGEIEAVALIIEEFEAHCYTIQEYCNKISPSNGLSGYFLQGHRRPAYAKMLHYDP